MKKYFSLAVAVFALLMTEAVTGQGTVPAGIHYQAVARDNNGKEIINTEIEVQFTIRTSSSLGAVVYREVHNDVTTSKYGVFSLIVGKGTRVDGTAASFADIDWSTANHWLQVEVKFDQLFMDMGTLQFMAVPYALYAGKSLEPGPQGPPGIQGPPGPEASDDQQLSIINIEGSDYLAISGGNSVKISSIEKDGDPTNEIQDLNYNAVNRTLSLSRSTAPAIDLSELKNDADADPTNEIQTVTYNADNHQLTLSNGGGSPVLDPLIALRAGISSAIDLPNNTPVVILFDQVTGAQYYNDGAAYSPLTGVFQALYAGIYSFSVYFANLPTNSSVVIRLNGVAFETLIGPITSSGSYKSSLNMKLLKNETVSIAIVQTNGFTIPGYNLSGYFTGYRVY